MLDALLLPERYCWHCGCDISHRKKSARTCGERCRQQRFNRRFPDRRPRRSGVPLYTGNSRRKRRKSRRPPTRYLVFRLDGKKLVPAGVAVADRPDRAKHRISRETGVAVGDLCTVPEHNLR